MCRKCDEGHGSHPGLGEPCGCDCRFTREEKSRRKWSPASFRTLRLPAGRGKSRVFIEFLVASGVLNREGGIFLYLWLKGIFPLKITEQWPICPWRLSYITLHWVGSWDKGILGHKKEKLGGKWESQSLLSP